MIKKIDQLQQAIQTAEARRDHLKADLQKAEQAMIEDPGREDLAMTAARLELQVKAAEKGIQRVRDEYQAEHERLAGPEAQEAIKELEKINKEGVKLTADLTKAAEALHDQMTKWESLQKQSQRLARKYDQQPFDLGIAGSRLWRVKNAISIWTQEVHSWKRNLEIMAMPKNGFKAARQNMVPERQKMIKKRYDANS